MDLPLLIEEYVVDTEEIEYRTTGAASVELVAVTEDFSAAIEESDVITD